MASQYTFFCVEATNSQWLVIGNCDNFIALDNVTLILTLMSSHDFLGRIERS